MTKRNTSLDILRLIAITCVILLHIIVVFRHMYFDTNKLYFSVYTFLDSFTRIGVPIFFMLTGILMLNKEDEKSYGTFLKKKISKLLISFIAFYLIYILYDIVFRNSIFSLKDIIQTITSKIVYYHLWYMPVIILIYVLIPFIRRLVKNLSQKELNQLILVVFLLGNVTTSISVITARLGRPLFDNFLFPSLMCYGNYLLIGYYVDKYKPSINWKKTIIAIASFLLVLPSTLLISNIEMKEFFLDSISPFVVIYSTYVVMIILHKKVKIKNEKTTHFIKIIGESSFYMYLIHVLWIMIIQDHFQNIIRSDSLLQSLVSSILLFIIVWVLSFAFSVVLNKIIYFIKNKKEQIGKKLIGIFLVVMCFLFLFFLISLWINHYHFTDINIALLFLIEVLIILIFYVIYKNQKRLNNKWLVIGGLILYVIIQFIIIYCYAVRPTWDFGTIYYLARDVASNKQKFNTVYYLYICDNNIPLAAFFTIIFKPLYLLGLEKFTSVLSLLVNIIAVDVSFVYLYKIVKKINSSMAFPFMIFSLFVSPLLFYLPIFYSDTLSLPFVVVPLYYLINYIYEEKKTKYIVIAGLLLGIGTLVKASVAILLIAIMLLSLFKQTFQKKHLVWIIVFFLIPIFLHKTYVNLSFSKEEMNKSKKPMTHFIMMGLKDKGGFNEEDMQFTTKIGTYQEKKKKTIEKIKERLYNYYSNHQLLKFYNKKINFTWADGTFYASRKLGSEYKHPQWQKYIQQQSKEAWFYFNASNAQWSIILILMIMGIIGRKYLSEKEQQIQLLLLISTFGIFMFLIIWETRSRYLVNFMPVFLINAFMGLCGLKRYVIERKEGKQS